MIEPTYAHVVRSGAMGDVLYAEPVIRAVAEQQECEVSVYCDQPYAQLFDNHPIVKNIGLSKCENDGNPQIPYRCNLMYNLNWVYENAWFKGDTRYIPDLYLDHFNLPKPSPAHPQIYLSEEEKRPLPSLPKGEKILVVHAVSRWRIEGWPTILDHAKKLGFFVVGFGQDRKGYHPDLPFDLDLRNKTTFREMLSLIHTSNAIVTLESGPLPLADCMGKKGIALIFESEPQSILRPNTNLKWLPCHDLPFDFLGIRKIGLKESHLHLKVPQIIKALEEL